MSTSPAHWNHIVGVARPSRCVAATDVCCASDGLQSSALFRPLTMFQYDLISQRVGASRLLLESNLFFGRMCWNMKERAKPEDK